MCPRPNQEKLFYAALMKHREENLENYLGTADSISYPASDYQHAQREAKDLSPVPNQKQHSQSQYSIMNDEHLRTPQSIGENIPSDSSYDPYRPSRYRTTPNGSPSTKVTVHRRGDSNGSRKAYMQHSLRHPNALRVEMLKKNGHTISSSSLVKQVHRKSMIRSTSKGSISRNSVVSSIWPSSPPIMPRTVSSHKHKRNVSFSHVRKSSTSTAGTPHAKRFTPELQAKARRSQLMHGSPTLDTGSPSFRAESAVRSKKDKTVTPAPRTRPRKSSTGARTDIRKASSELEAACEEAFNRSSFSSSVFTTTSTNEKAGPYDTPPSSVSKRDSGSSIKENVAPPRPLPAVPTDTPNTFIHRTLEETRSKLAARSASESNDGSAKIEQVLANLDRLIPPGDRRIISAPDSHTIDSRAPLPIISEEGRSDISQGRSVDGGHRYRSVTAPMPETRTVRMVQSSSPTSPNSPYNWRPIGEPASELSEHTVVDRTHLAVPTADPRMTRKKSSDSVVPLRKTSSQGSEGPEPAVKKKSSWFRRWKEPSASAADSQHRSRSNMPREEVVNQATRPVKPNVLIRDNQPPHLDLSNIQPPAPKSSSSSEFPMRSESRGFSKWFTRKRSADRCEFTKKGEIVIVTDPAIAVSPPSAANTPFSQSFSGGPLSPLPPTTPGSANDNTTRSWFSRFLRLRPEVQTLAFNVPRTRARTELVRMLRDWQRHGIKDLTYFPQDNAITASVDKVNTLGIKPVTFRIELFVVLKNGRKAGLSLARCSQMRGAASSFRKVVEILEQVAKDRGLLVEDEAQRNELCGILS